MVQVALIGVRADEQVHVGTVACGDAVGGLPADDEAEGRDAAQRMEGVPGAQVDGAQLREDRDEFFVRSVGQGHGGGRIPEVPADRVREALGLVGGEGAGAGALDDDPVDEPLGCGVGQDAGDEGPQLWQLVRSARTPYAASPSAVSTLGPCPGEPLAPHRGAALAVDDPADHCGGFASWRKYGTVNQLPDFSLVVSICHAREEDHDRSGGLDTRRKRCHTRGIERAQRPVRLHCPEVFDVPGAPVSR